MKHIHKVTRESKQEFLLIFFFMAILLLNEFDERFVEIKAKYPSSSIKWALRYVKEARKVLQEAEGIKFIENEILKCLIKEKHEELNSIEDQIKNKKTQDNPQQVQIESEQTARQKENDIKAAEEALQNNDLVNAEKILSDLKNVSFIDTSQQDKLKNLNKQYKTQKKENLFAEFDTLLKSCSKKTTVDRLNRLKGILSEASLLVTDYSDITKIKEKRSMLDSLELTKEDDEHIAKEKEKNNTPQQENFAIVDPFDQLSQVPDSLMSNINTHLETLCENPLDNRDSEKLKFLNDTWRIRVGDYRVLYTILPQRHSIGIVRIEYRKDVYENQETDENRIGWFRAVNLATNDQIRLKITEEKNTRKIDVLNKFLQKDK
jgi:mRNA interferase RelE/StbE